MNRVVITGLGVISAAGHNAADFWRKISNGRSSIGEITTIPTDKWTVKIGAEVAGFEPQEYFEKRQLGMLDRFSQFGLIAAREAISDSGISFEGEAGERAAAVIGSGVGGQTTLDDSYWTIYAEKKSRVHPFTVPRLMINAATSHITMEHGIKGPAYSIASACSSANHAMGQAFLMVRNGMADAAVTGGAEDNHRRHDEGLCALRVMSNDTCVHFQRAGRVWYWVRARLFSFSRRLKRRKRGGKIYAVVGHGLSSDAMDKLPTLGCRRQLLALKDGGLNPEDITYVNAHGTWTAERRDGNKGP